MLRPGIAHGNTRNYIWEKQLFCQLVIQNSISHKVLANRQIHLISLNAYFNLVRNLFQN